MSREEAYRLLGFVMQGGVSFSAEAIIIFQKFSDKSVSTQTFGHPVAVGELSKVIGGIAECLQHPGEEDRK